MRPDPKPKHAILEINSKCAIVQADAHRAVPTDVLEAERGMTWIDFEELKAFISEGLDVRGKPFVAAPKAWRRVMLQRGRERPAR